MNELQKEIFENYQVRKTKEQKARFIKFAKEKAAGFGYETRVEPGMLGAKNIVVGDIESAKVVYTAHYDTCPVLPFPNFITPKCFIVYLLYQIVLVAAMFLAVFAGTFLIGLLIALLPINELISVLLIELTSFGFMFALVFLLLMGPANKNTANDNTSGVTELFEIMRALPEEDRGSVAFVFFDLEEMGLFGSASFAKKNKDDMKDKLLINFDCISDGDNFLFALKKDAEKYKELLERAYVPTAEEGRVEVLTKGVFYPSDQANFRLGIGACALKATKGGLLYMNRIHTKKDIIYREENISFFTRGSVELVRLLKEG